MMRLSLIKKNILAKNTPISAAVVNDIYLQKYNKLNTTCVFICLDFKKWALKLVLQFEHVAL